VRRLYAESNFVLELVLAQDDKELCSDLLAATEAGDFEFVLPTFCLAEPIDTLVRRHKERRRLQEGIENEAMQLRRTSEYQEALRDVDAATALLARSTSEDLDRLESSYLRIAGTAQLAPLTAETVRAAFDLKKEYDLPTQDAFVLATVLVHAERSPAESALVTKNSKDFDDPGVRRELDRRGCRLLTSFGQAVGFALHDA
jgi:predicted nucleic acid-binding protein